MNVSPVYLHLKELVSAEQLKQIQSLLAQAPYQDGKNTATDQAKEVKNNEQMNVQSTEYMAVQQILLTAINHSPLFRNAVFPKNIYPFLVSKYTSGKGYGWHVDSPLMGNMMRTDIAMTIFLNDPSEYEGGELELQTHIGNTLYKLNAGDAICYPCTQVHRVREVLKGERHVAVTWIESQVKDAEERNILYNLFQVMNNLKVSPTHLAEQHSLQQSYSNLLRKWSM
jgi:PKHD-type hydroxylase